MKPIFIAEIKTQSPFGYRSEHTFAELMEYAIKYGDWISVHTNALWGGDFDSVSFVRRNTNKPILAKGIHATDDDIQRAIDHGADWVLVVDRMNFASEFRKHVLVETNDQNIFNHPNLGNHKLASPVSVYRDLKYVCNSRDLRTGLRKQNYELPLFIDAGAWVCQASGIRQPKDVHPKVNAFIVGTYLTDFCDFHMKP